MLEIYNLIITNPITNSFVGIYQLLYSLHIPFAFGFAIIGLTSLIRVILLPFTSAQIKSTVKMQKISHKLNALKEKHKGDSKKLNDEMMKLYKEHGVNPAAGCLPMLVQIPVTISLYYVLRTAVNIHSLKALAPVNKVLYADFLKIQKIWDTTFFGLPLASSPKDLFAHQPYLVLIPLLTGLLQFVLTKMMMPEEVIEAEEKVVKKTETKEDDMQVALQKQSMFLFPAMIAFSSFMFPLGLSLYWNTFSIFGILQQYLLIGPGGAAQIFNKIKLNGRNK